MLSSSSIICCCSYSKSLLSLSDKSQLLFSLNSKEQFNLARKFSISSKLPRTPYRYKLHCTATQEQVETDSPPSGLVGNDSPASRFVETGYVYGVHGLHGEVRVKPFTDFPDLRFSQPGTRWLKQQVSGIDTFQEIELAEGRGHPGQNWIVKFEDINTVEQAQKLVGSAILVKDEDRPVLEEGEFYTHDLIGMRVVLKETGEPIGTVASVFNSGASDLLRVKLNPLRNNPEQIGKSKLGASNSGPLVWVPFVESIVPTVDLEKGEMLITPPKGLLELNVRSDERSKKERRESDWKERKKFQRRLTAAKKKLSEMEQQHVFHGFKHGEKDQGSLLANQIVTVNSTLLQQALQNIETPSTRPNLLQILNAVPRSNTVRVSNNPSSAGHDDLSNPYRNLKSGGHLITSNGKVAIFLILEENEQIEKSSDNLVNSDGSEESCLLVKALLDNHLKSIKMEDRSSIPLVLVCSAAHSVSSLQEYFSDHDYFAFDHEKVWFLEEERLPVVGSSSEEQKKHKILMKSPWEFLQRPIGSGGMVSLLSSHDSLFDKLTEIGVKYIEVCKTNQKLENSDMLLGLVDSCKANVGIQLFKELTSEEEFDVILSMSFVKKWVKQINKLRFDAVLASNSYVEKVENDWVDVVPSAPNSYEFRCSIYSCLDLSPINKVCVLDSTEQ